MGTKPRIELAGTCVGIDFEPIVFAELGINHGGDLAVAKELASSALSAGARFIKHQTHIPDAEMSSEARSAIPGNSNKSIFEIMEECSLTESEEFELAAHVRRLGGVFFSTPFSREAVERLESLDVPFYKIGSGECNNYPFVDYVASKGRPVVLSTGMNTLREVSRSVEILKSRGVEFALLHTTNLYPTPSQLLRLGGVSELMANFDAPVGLSDHSISNYACLGAVALGASILERHYVDSRETRSGPDVVCSMDRDDLIELQQGSRELFLARGGYKFLTEEEQVTANFAFASVAATQDIQAGQPLSKDNCFPIRPGGGDFRPEDYDGLLGKLVNRDIAKGVQISREDVES